MQQAYTLFQVWSLIFFQYQLIKMKPEVTIEKIFSLASEWMH